MFIIFTILVILSLCFYYFIIIKPVRNEKKKDRKHWADEISVKDTGVAAWPGNRYFDKVNSAQTKAVEEYPIPDEGQE